jgi:hypothetical protein
MKAMSQHQMLPPPLGATTKVNGRTYTCAAGATLLVPDFDGIALQSAGWILVAEAGAGTTAQRPTVTASGQPLTKGMRYHDTTLGKLIIYDGSNAWRDTNTGAVV